MAKPMEIMKETRKDSVKQMDLKTRLDLQKQMGILTVTKIPMVKQTD